MNIDYEELAQTIFAGMRPGSTSSTVNIARKNKISTESARKCVAILLDNGQIEQSRDYRSTVYGLPVHREAAAPARNPWEPYTHSRAMLATIERVAELRRDPSRF